MQRMQRRRRVAMAMAGLVAAVLLAMPATGAPSPAKQPPRAIETQLYRIEGVATMQERSAIASHGISIDVAEPNAVVTTASLGDVAMLRQLGYTVTPVLTPDRSEGIARSQDFPSGDSAYHNYAETNAKVQATAANFPNLVSRFSIGRSYQNRELWAVKISDNVATDENEPEAL